MYIFFKIHELNEVKRITNKNTNVYEHRLVKQ